MFGRGVSEQVRHIEADIGTVKRDLTALQADCESARQDEVRGWHQVEAAQARQARLLRKIDEHLEALLSLNLELAVLIPQQRDGAP